MIPLVTLRLEYAYGGPGGHCPRVLNPFLSTSYSLKLALLSEYLVLTADPS